ncbi:glycosyltransferase [Lederbergia panacisoli]|uniref:glycosyltransferase n=1 Tax=Lederbergia panacisoli TaxID=1255251 RepID=UPI00214B3666|nr:glycosyltransferase [Lederbergia panacisoli]MCR2822024.1 glycosyltransferase [Lederbergia panacisoli]
MKKRLLFVIDSLVAAGAEKSLITLLSLLDYKRFSVDLMLFAHGELLEKLVPKEVNILRPLKYTDFTTLTLKNAFFYSFKKRNFEMLSSRVKYSMHLRLKQYNNPQKARLYWSHISNVIEENSTLYDIAISYAQGVPTFYVAEKIKAKKKFAWVNITYRLDQKEAEYQKQFYDQYNQIVAVSDVTKEVFLDTFPFYKEKVNVIYDINDPDFISNMANIGEDFQDDFDGIRILTIGRLAYQKGYDIALDACKKLKKKGIKFKWYVLGKGPLLEEIQDFIKGNDLSDHFKLLGVTDNPYSYIKKCDIYVQTSRFEGFGLAIAEARMLNRPVVTTMFDSVFNQMKDGKNGLVVGMNGEAVCEGIIRLIQDKNLNKSIVNYLRLEKKGNVEELNKFYQLIG